MSELKNYDHLLAIDSACSFFSVALSCGGDIHYAETDGRQKQSEIAMEFADSLLKKACIKPKDLSGVICMGGPGSFTGLRIGYSIAKGLALSLSIPFAPIPTLDCIAFGHSQKEDDIIIPVIQSRKNAYYYTIFRNTERLCEDKDGDLTQIKDEIKKFLTNENKIIMTGPLSCELYNSLPADFQNDIILNFENKGYAKELICIAKNKKILDNDLTAFLTSGPEYVRKTDAELNAQI
ncbi:MAG: tRNA (adenosine(37)-N6)-threonylcarbamoyltransferase complex dimerization subunit type 1 TsaB [Treponema sp.]|nr:tRNA (adenosine(37)-N6)-threonylcarbamoyltransferase complex dimerization subunit type 1 TsaB [Treponema sp.]MCL2236832.1 tRNA (adenosine(37)-N6)-threonylcarbamoyltransferase complex dimerization subunit type 1 TsaB [Treponema sp.]